MSACLYCGTAFPPKGVGGNPRKWCNDRCRLLAKGQDCIYCGKRTTGTGGCRECVGGGKPVQPVLSFVVTPLACWEWQGTIDRDGYGIASAGRNRLRAHRFTYATVNGPIPDDLVIDHLCRNRKCCNPAHLEPVTNRENARRGLKGVLQTHCKHGHPFDERNTHWTTKGGRVCKTCRRASSSGRSRSEETVR